MKILFTLESSAGMEVKMKQIKGGVTAAKGFKAASTAAGIKYKDRTDMAMIYSEVPCAVAGTFTTNIVKAAPVKWDQHVVYDSKNGTGSHCQCRYCKCMYRRRGDGLLQKATAEKM